LQLQRPPSPRAHAPAPGRSLQTRARTSHLHAGKEKAPTPSFVPTEMPTARAGCWHLRQHCPRAAKSPLPSPAPASAPCQQGLGGPSLGEQRGGLHGARARLRQDAPRRERGALRWVWLPPATRVSEPPGRCRTPVPVPIPNGSLLPGGPRSSWSWGGIPSTGPSLAEGRGADPCPGEHPSELDAASPPARPLGPCPPGRAGRGEIGTGHDFSSRLDTRTHAHTPSSATERSVKTSFTHTHLRKARTSRYGRGRGGRWLRYCTGVNVNNTASSERASQETKRTVALYKNALETTHFSPNPSTGEACQLLSTGGAAAHRAHWVTISPHWASHHPPTSHWHGEGTTVSTQGPLMPGAWWLHCPDSGQGGRRAPGELHGTQPSSPFPFLPSRSEPPDLQGFHNSARKPPPLPPSACPPASQRKNQSCWAGAEDNGTAQHLPASAALPS